jgi:hypothetical protein
MAWDCRIRMDAPQFAGLFSTALPYIADSASVLGLLVSVYVLLEVTTLKRRFLCKARLPQLKNAISKHAARISEKLNNFDDCAHELDAELSRCVASLTSLKYKTDRETKNMTKALEKKIRRRDYPLQKDQVWSIYNDIQGLAARLGHLHEDMKWD